MLNYGPVYSEYYRWFRWMMVLSAAGAVAGPHVGRAVHEEPREPL